ncbi:beta-lactamase regulating signal transducer with metallopeptidase domain [Xanthomonas campestris]|uniref:M56 family metallopeptidase n=1 Tax=Xanthomonas sp. CFBP 8151 TaxID=3035310 RepID=UPI00141A6CAB|nr:M56 family metallopeptidase [Xanthomonas sp. CFBP 8151]NIJ77559.1 beta-lactamase regulating signal transducer with metallopeptidase domain [Xanthomonas sp. CFBP 8151]
MSLPGLELLLTAGVHHLWQSALVVLLVVLLLRGKASAAARSWVVLCAFGLSAVSPLAILLPGAAVPLEINTPSEATTVMQPSASVLDVDRIDRNAHGEELSLPAAVAIKGLAAVWLLGTLWSLMRLLQGWNLARLMRSNTQRAPDLERLLGSALPRKVCIALSESAAGPMVMGLIRPRILVPTALASALAPAVMTDLLLHELAHLQRRDLWVSTLQRVVLALYWWSPFMHRLGTQVDLTREMACDERAAQRAGSGRSYARSLLDGASRLAAHRNDAMPLAVGMSGHRGGLAQRIDDLLEMETRSAARHRHLGWAAVCVAALSLQIGLTLAATPRMGTAAAATPGPEADIAGAAQLIYAATKGRLHEVRELVASGVAVDARVRGDGTALIVASKRGDLAMVEQLLELGARPDQASVGDGNPLIAAAHAGHIAVVERLIAAGANVNGIVVHDETPLINAARRGHLAVVTSLVEHGADVNLGVVADAGQWRSPLNQASTQAIRSYLSSKGAVLRR